MKQLSIIKVEPINFTIRNQQERPRYQHVSEISQQFIVPHSNCRCHRYAQR